MPLPMFFHTLYQGQIDIQIALGKMEEATDSMLFLPEMIALRLPLEDFWFYLSSDSTFMTCLRIIRSHPVLPEDQIRLTTEMTREVLSLAVRTQAAILTDEVRWLTLIASESHFQFSTKQVSLAARYGSIKCFRFVSVNRAKYSQEVLEAAIYGGNEEMIQMCLEHECNPKSDVMMRESIRGEHGNIVGLGTVYGVVSTSTDVV